MNISTLSIKEFLSFPVRKAELRDVTYFVRLHALKTGLPVRGSSTVVLFCRVGKWNCNMCDIVTNS